MTIIHNHFNHENLHGRGLGEVWNHVKKFFHGIGPSGLLSKVIGKVRTYLPTLFDSIVSPAASDTLKKTFMGSKIDSSYVKPFLNSLKEKTDKVLECHEYKLAGFKPHYSPPED